MAHTNETSNYELTQFVGSDKPAWLVDYNGDMLAIDTAMKAISDVADAAKSKADTNETNIATVTTTANSASAKASGAISDISDEYDPTSTYAVGDLVIYNNLLYKCTTAITVPEAFDGTHWTRTTIEELIDTINSNLSVIGNIATDTDSFVGNSSSTYKRVAELTTLNAGTYIFFGYCDLSKSTDVTITLQLRSSGSVLKTVRGSGTAGGGLCIAYPLTISANADINIVLYDNISGITARGELKAISIK